MKHDDSEYVIRFSRTARLEHAIVILLFFALVLTGLPQKWPYAEMSRTVIDLCGGIFATRFIHRVAGVLFSLLAIWHVGRVVGMVLLGRSHPTMFFTRRDFTDAIQNLRYHLGRADTPPPFGRYDYRQKFEYWGLLFGSLVMVGSGFMLYFPLLFVRYLPAEVIPAAKVMHSNEALLALLIVLIWHIYGTVLSPEVFPLDKSIFTGKVSKEHLRKERPLEYAELFGPE